MFDISRDIRPPQNNEVHVGKRGGHNEFAARVEILAGLNTHFSQQRQRLFEYPSLGQGYGNRVRYVHDLFTTRQPDTR